MGISIRAYARHRGIAHNAVHKAIKAGRIQVEKNGTIEVAKADADWEKNTDPNKTRPVKTASVKTGSVKRPVADQTSSVVTSGATLQSFPQVRLAHEIAKTGLARQRLQERKGQLINKDRVKAQIFRLGRQLRDAWINWPSRVSAQMAAELQVDEHRVHMTLETYVREHLNELGESKLNIE